MVTSVLALPKLPVSHNLLPSWMLGLMFIYAKVCPVLHESWFRWQSASPATWEAMSGLQGRGLKAEGITICQKLRGAGTWWDLFNQVSPLMHTPLIATSPSEFSPFRQTPAFFFPRVYLVQVPPTPGKKTFWRFAWGCKAGSHVRQSRLAAPALMLWIAACRMPVACL